MKYEIDDDDRITWVSKDWDTFANENDAPELIEDYVLGTSLWDYFAHDKTEFIYRRLLSGLRRTGQPVEFLLNCDSAQEARQMRMVMRLLPRDGVEMTVQQLSARPRNLPISMFKWSVDGAVTLPVCSWCNKAYVTFVGWLEMENALHLNEAFCKGDTVHLTHGICDECESVLGNEIAAMQNTPLVASDHH